MWKGRLNILIYPSNRMQLIRYLAGKKGYYILSLDKRIPGVATVTRVAHPSWYTTPEVVERIVRWIAEEALPQDVLDFRWTDELFPPPWSRSMNSHRGQALQRHLQLCDVSLVSRCFRSCSQKYIFGNGAYTKLHNLYGLCDTLLQSASQATTNFRPSLQHSISSISLTWTEECFSLTHFQYLISLLPNLQVILINATIHNNDSRFNLPLIPRHTFEGHPNYHQCTRSLKYTSEFCPRPLRLLEFNYADGHTKNSVFMPAQEFANILSCFSQIDTLRIAGLAWTGENYINEVPNYPIIHNVNMGNWDILSPLPGSPSQRLIGILCAAGVRTPTGSLQSLKICHDTREECAKLGTLIGTYSGRSLESLSLQVTTGLVLSLEALEDPAGIFQISSCQNLKSFELYILAPKFWRGCCGGGAKDQGRAKTSMKRVLDLSLQILSQLPNTIRRVIIRPQICGKINLLELEELSGFWSNVSKTLKRLENLEEIVIRWVVSFRCGPQYLLHYLTPKMEIQRRKEIREDVLKYMKGVLVDRNVTIALEYEANYSPCISEV